MSMDLFGTEYSFNVSNLTWVKLLTLAKDHGWVAQGVESTDLLTNGKGIVEVAKNNYTSNDGQYVSKNDALLIANALEKALDKIPDSENDQKDQEYSLEDVIEILTSGNQEEIEKITVDADLEETPFEICSCDKTYILECIKFFRTGGFYIY